MRRDVASPWLAWYYLATFSDSRPGKRVESAMAVARVTEIVASSNISFQDAITQGIERAARTLRGMTGMKVIEQKAKIEGGKISEYRVQMAITFVLDE